MMPIQMELSKKQENFSQFFSPFFKSSLNFEYFETKDDGQGFCISRIRDSKNGVK